MSVWFFFAVRLFHTLTFTQIHSVANTLLNNIFDFDGGWKKECKMKKKKPTQHGKKRWNKIAIRWDSCAFSLRIPYHTHIDCQMWSWNEFHIHLSLCCVCDGILCVFRVCIVSILCSFQVHANNNFLFEYLRCCCCYCCHFPPCSLLAPV